jgi:hypothetical protein
MVGSFIFEEVHKDGYKVNDCIYMVISVIDKLLDLLLRYRHDRYSFMLG